MNKLFSRWGGIALALCMALLAGCAGPQVAGYAAEKPLLDLRQYFNGRQPSAISSNWLAMKPPSQYAAPLMKP